MMRAIAAAILGAAFLWGGWWWIGATGLERGTRAAIDGARAKGWTIAVADLSVAGFPNRFDLTLTDPTVSPPDGGWRWSAPFVQIFALSYRPNHVISVVPPGQTIAGPWGVLRVSDDDLRASIVVTPGPDLALERATLAGRGLVFDHGGSRWTLDAGQVAVRSAAAMSNGYNIAVGLERIVVPEALARRIDPDGAWPTEIGAMTLDATLTLDRRIDRHMDGPPRVEGMSIASARLRWGSLDIALAGDIAADPQGLAEGALTFTVGRDGTDAIVSLLEPFVPDSQGALARAALRGLVSRGDGTIRLAVEKGVVRFGFVPLVRLPPFRMSGN